MLVNQPGKYVVSPQPRSESSLLLAPKKLWAAMAMDFGAYNDADQTPGSYQVAGLNDLRYLVDDLWSLVKAKKVRAPEASVAGEEDRPLRLEGRLRKQLPTYFRNRDPAYRSSEILEGAAAVADQLGYRVSENDDRPDVWVGSDESSLRRVHEFHHVLREHIASCAFRDALRQREDRAEREWGCQDSLLFSICSRIQRVGVIAIDLGFQPLQMPYGLTSAQGYASPSLLACADQLLNGVQFDPSFGGKVLGAVVHLEYHQEHGQYLRVFFLVIPEDMGYRQLFLVRLLRGWQFIVGQRGWIDDCRRHPNKVVSSVGQVSMKDESSIMRLRRALAYGIHKDLHMQVNSEGIGQFIVRELRPAIFDSQHAA